MYYFGTRIKQQNLSTDLVIEGGAPVRIYSIVIYNSALAVIDGVVEGRNGTTTVFRKTFHVSGNDGANIYVDIPFIADKGFTLTATAGTQKASLQATVLYFSPGN